MLPIRVRLPISIKSKMDQKMWRNIKKSVCATCLSRNRTLILASDVDQLKEIFPDHKFGPYDMICWECKALTARAVAFKRRAYMAFDIFLDIRKKKVTLDSVKSLSQLTKLDTDIISYNDTYKHFDEEMLPSYKIDKQVKAEIKCELKLEPDHSSEEVVADHEEIVAAEYLEVEINRVDDEDCTSLLKGGKSEGSKDSRIIHLTDIDPKTGKCYNSVIKMIMVSETELEKLRSKKALHQNSTFKCSSCVETFRDGAALDAHNIKHSDISGMFSCHICKLRMSTQKQLEDHTVLHFRCFECLVCEHKSLDFDVALKHYDHNHHIQLLECEHCSQTFRTAREMKLHKRTHRALQVCPECGKTYTTADSLKAHINMIHKGMKMECPICHKLLCGGTFNLKKHIAAHGDKVDEAAFCAKCCKQFRTVEIYKNHLKTSLKHVAPEDFRFKCSHCEKRFGTGALLKSHLLVHSDDANFKCHVCSKAFKTARRLRDHIDIKHEGKVIPKDKVCDICGKGFNNKTTLQQHLNSHLGHRPYVCDICSDSFCFSAALYTHKKLKHGKKPAKDK